MAQSRESLLSEFIDFVSHHIKGDEKSETPIFLDRLFRAFGQQGLLEAAVLEAYRFDATKELLAQLLEPNLSVAAREKQNLPVTAPGVPPSHGDPARLVTDDCIHP